ncbi:hypothetical protein GGX14DRAFT_428833 [Mycena pura]|uniref:GAT domain-containing protein n=1 Tax=Mycena pura TaxID=153505 RepID=A0AAD6YLB3_9AGAR|nr:hypothetical protein GGX14DRAFT_428833 [Mycena pura]
MLRNSSDTFISQSTSRKFLDTLEDLLSSTRTSPVVRERVMDVLAAAAYASGSKKDTGFRGLWRRVKPRDKPEEGVPFDTEDAMFNPPLGGVRVPVFDYDNVPVAPIVTYQDATPIEAETPQITKPPPRRRKTSDKGDKPHREHHRDPRHRIIPPDEDMRRLFQECKMGVGNANLLSEALAMATPDDLGSAVITEFHKKCMASQELIFTQIPWASAGAERSRAARDQQEEKERKRKNSENTLNPANLQGNDSLPDLAAPASTREEDLFGELLIANEQLLEALKLYDDLKRVAVERETEDRSRREVRLDPRERQYLMEDGMLHSDVTGGGGGGGGSSSRSRSPSPARAPVQHTPPNQPQNVDVFPLTQPQQSLAPPPAAPHGPRSPGVSLSRTPSPGHPDAGAGAGAELANGLGAMRVGGAGVHTREHAATNGRGSFDTNGRGSIDERREAYSEDDGDERAMQPSAKALGKRKVVADPLDHGQSGDEMSMGPKDGLDDRLTDSDDDEDSPLGLRHRSVQQYVYDAVAERMQQRLRDGHQLLVNGVH